MLRRRFLLGGPTLAAMGVVTASVGWGRTPGSGAVALKAAIDGAQRSPKNIQRDRYRHPFETLMFWGLKPGMTVIEVEPSGGYWTEILAPYLMATGGKYIGAVGGDASAFQARYADRQVWGDLTVVPLGGPLCAPGAADMVITARNIHDWMWTPGRLDTLLASFHAALKSHGVLAVEEHRADPRPMVPEGRDGYVSTAVLVGDVDKAGFALQARSEINANPRDTKDYPLGVWTLPPTLRSHAKDQPTPADYDAARYVAIGESDRMTLRFRRV
jgi:predicted methyltransferase